MWEVCHFLGCCCGGGMSFGMCFLISCAGPQPAPNCLQVTWGFHFLVKCSLSYGISKFFDVLMNLSMPSELSTFNFIFFPLVSFCWFLNCTTFLIKYLVYSCFQFIFYFVRKLYIALNLVPKLFYLVQ